MKKKLAGIILAASIAVSAAVPALAYELPNAFWGLNDKYEAALQNKDYSGTAQYGGSIIDLILSEEKNDQTSNIIGSRAYETAFAYYFLGDYANAVKYFNIYIPYGTEQGWDDGVKIAGEFIKQLTPSFDIYKYTSEEQKYFGARNEPHGVLYGQVSESVQPGESMILLYLEYGNQSEFNWANVIMKKANNEGLSVELALNFPNEGADARTLRASDSYLSSLASMLSSYPNVPVYLRIGSEMNIWNTVCTPDEYISAFRTVANRMRAFPNVASVWSIAHTSRWQGADWPYTADDFYPGDEYVDWVGVSAYTAKYFNGQIWSGTSVFNEICFKAGYSSDPVLMIKDVADTYGGRKPIMVSECGSAYKTNGSVNEYHHSWAAAQLKKLYSFIPMVYPQVKLMAYFNKNMSYEVNYYDLDGSPELAAAYSSIVRSPWLIHGSSRNRAETFFEKAAGTISTDGTLTLGAYPHMYGADTITVDYYLDGEHIQSAAEAPYKAKITGLRGSHTLRVSASGSNGAYMEREYSIQSSLTAENADEFSDAASLSEIQKNAVDYALQNGIITGYEDNTFRPMNTITRAEFTAMICRMMKYSADTPCTFSDAAAHWGSRYINACVSAGAINGVGNNMFAPDSSITFEQAAKILTVVSGIADSSAKYPDGFISAGETVGLFENLTSKENTAALRRIDAVVMMAQAR